MTATASRVGDPGDSVARDYLRSWSHLSTVQPVWWASRTCPSQYMENRPGGYQRLTPRLTHRYRPRDATASGVGSAVPDTALATTRPIGAVADSVPVYSASSCSATVAPSHSDQILDRVATVWCGRPVWSNSLPIRPTEVQARTSSSGQSLLSGQFRRHASDLLRRPRRLPCRECRPFSVATPSPDP